MSASRPVRRGDTFPEPTPADPFPNPFLTALGSCFPLNTGIAKPRITAWVYCRCSCGRSGQSQKKLYEVCRIRRNKNTGEPNTRSCGCYREKIIIANNELLRAWRVSQPSRWPLGRLRTQKVLAHLDVLDKRADDVVIKQRDRIHVRCKKCGKEKKKPAVEIERHPDACDRCSGKEQWTLGRVRTALKNKCILLNDDGSVDRRPDDTKVRLSDERCFRCLHCGHVSEPKKIFGQVNYADSVCSECHPRKQWRLGRFRRLVKSLGGRVLGLSEKSDAYPIKVRQKIRVECALRHTDRKSAAHVARQQTLCNECSAGLYERIVRAHFEAIFGVPFVKSRPKWLKNEKTNRLLELDGFAASLRLAFEHDGPQHYGRKIRANQTQQELNTIRELHALKNRLCRKNKVILIRIVSMVRIAASDELREAILEKCRRVKVRVPFPKAIEQVVDAPESLRIWQELREQVADRGGKLLTRSYGGSTSKVRVFCGNRKHVPFQIAPRKLRAGQWCRKCYDLSLLNQGAVLRGYSDNEEWLRSVLQSSGCKLLSRVPPNLCHRTKGLIVNCKCGKKQKPKTFNSIVTSKAGGCCDSCKQM
jgi:hypothetical protein